MSNPFLNISGLSKSFGETRALKSIDFQLMEDELLVILGSTGAGKTTLLRTISGLETLDAGQIQMAGHDISRLSPAERDVALVFQNFSLYPDWTVRRNLTFPLMAPGRRMPQKERDERIEWAAEILQIKKLLDRPSNKLSGGEMQRVAIGRALVRRPKLFLMDEPLTNLDAKLRESLRVEIVCLRRTLKTPMIYVTHDQIEALSMADRIVVLDEGQILQVGTPQEIYHRPVSTRVAKQLGQPEVNLIEATRSDDAWVTTLGVPIGPASRDGMLHATIGVRPEDVKTQGGHTEGTVRVVEDMGPEIILVVEWQGQELHILAEKPCSLHPGDTVKPSFVADRIMVWAR